MHVSVGTSTRFKLVPLWSFLFCSVNSVSSQVQVKGSEGASILLPCIYTGDDLPNRVSTYWRDKDDNIVLDIITNLQVLRYQSQSFRGRVQSFPDVYQKGNFSIIIENLQLSDSGPYDCHIPVVDFQTRVQLTVSGRRVEVMVDSQRSTVGNAEETPTSLRLTLLSVLISLLVSALNWTF